MTTKRFWTKSLIALFCTMLLFSTGAIPFLQKEESVHAASSKIEKVISTGMRYMGTPYKFGSNRNSTKTFDCSAFTRHIIKSATGVTIPSTSASQAAYVKKHTNIKTSLSSMKRGDLIFFMSYKGPNKSNYSKLNKLKQKVTHVGIYLGNGKILHTYSKASGGVRVDTIKNKHWEYRIIFGGSIL